MCLHWHYPFFHQTAKQYHIYLAGNYVALHEKHCILGSLVPFQKRFDSNQFTEGMSGAMQPKGTRVTHLQSNETSVKYCMTEFNVELNHITTHHFLALLAGPPPVLGRLLLMPLAMLWAACFGASYSLPEYDICKTQASLSPKLKRPTGMCQSEWQPKCSAAKSPVPMADIDLLLGYHQQSICEACGIVTWSIQNMYCTGYEVWRTINMQQYCGQHAIYHTKDNTQIPSHTFQAPLPVHVQTPAFAFDIGDYRTHPSAWSPSAPSPCHAPVVWALRHPWLPCWVFQHVAYWASVHLS